MRFLPIRNEGSVSEIADKVFANLNSTSRIIAEAAILKENPTLKNFSKVRTGTIVKIPTIPNLKIKGSRSVNDPIGDLAEETVESLAAYSKEFAANLNREKASIKTQAELFKQKELGNLLATTPEGKKIGTAFKTNLSQQSKENSEKGKLALKALEELQKTVQTLSE